MEVSDADREAANSVLYCAVPDSFSTEGQFKLDLDKVAEAFAKHRATQVAELDALREEVVTADHSRTCYARALEKMRIALVNINDGLEDEGDRIYLGSTNHADDIRAAWQIAEALNWDEILEHTQPKTDIAATNFRLQATIAQLRDRVAGLEEGLRVARGQFAFYVEQHLLKSPPDEAKAKTNQSHVERIDALLKQNEVG